MTLVYPPGLSAIFLEISRNNSETAILFLKYLKTILLLWVESSFDFVTSGSKNFFNAFAFVKVVFILLCSIKEQAILANIDFL